MEKQFKIYSLDTKAFYNKDEEKINKQLLWARNKVNLVTGYTLYTYLKSEKADEGKKMRYDFENIWDYYRQLRRTPYVFDKSGKYIAENQLDESTYVKKYISQLLKNNKEILKSTEFKKLLKENGIYNKYTHHEKGVKNEIDEINSSLNDKLESNTDTRLLNPKKISKYNLINLFDSDLSRVMKIDENQISTDLLIVRVYHYLVLEQLIDKGYDYLGEHYIALTASAGQIRTKKVLFIKEKTWGNIQNTIMCGLSIKDINESAEKGCNINKFLAYLALCTSASDEIKGFDITKCIVVKDFETVLKGRKVDYIDNETFIIDTNKTMDITIPHSDGCGWVLPSVSKKSFQLRMPWFKGLMVPVNYLSYAKEENGSNYKVIDIDNNERDLLEEGIEYVFSESQFKMHKYYKNWKQYQDNFDKYDCNANYCNKEENASDFKKAKFTYQMWQTLLDIKDEEIEEFTNPIDEYITKAYTDQKTMLNILGADKEKKKKNYLQQCLEIYPELLKDKYMQVQLSDAIQKTRKDSKGGKIKINAKNTFLIPDVVAWMEFVFKGEDKVTGILKDGEVSCKLFKNEPELIVNRSPHLFLEHCCRNNIINKDTNKWFITNGIYTSCHDLISKYLQFDNDGDFSLVVAEPVLISVIKRNMKGVLPLYYEMGKAKAKIINPKNIYDGLVTGFKYSNIGKYSNKLTGLWNKDIVTKDDINTAKVVTALNNYCIDSAKTLEMKTLIKGSDIEKAYKAANKLKMPYFFRFAKDADNVAERNNSTVNLICKRIEDIKTKNYNFSKFINFNPNMLMHNPNIEINKDIITEYNRLNKEMQKYFFKNDDMENGEIAVAVWEVMQGEFDKFCIEHDVTYTDGVDSILKHIYINDKNCKKSLLFNVFGNVILENLKANIKKPLDDGYIICACPTCRKRVKKENNRQIYCKVCSGKINKEKSRLNMQKKRKVEKIV